MNQNALPISVHCVLLLLRLISLKFYRVLKVDVLVIGSQMIDIKLDSWSSPNTRSKPKSLGLKQFGPFHIAMDIIATVV